MRFFAYKISRELAHTFSCTAAAAMAFFVKKKTHDYKKNQPQKLPKAQ